MPRQTPPRERLSMAGLIWDVTERKNLELSLQDADRRKDEFLATLAHELRNPLAPLRFGLQIPCLNEQGQFTVSAHDRDDGAPADAPRASCG